MKIIASRTPWSPAFPDALIHAEELSVKRHASYLDAKSGDYAAALGLVRELLNDSVIAQMRAWTNSSPILISVHAEEAMGKNAIPEVMADVLAETLGWDIEPNVVQANVVNHTGADGFSRLARQAIFSGAIAPNQNYVIVDDFIGQGGTIANLRGHVEQQGGQVIGATVLTGKPFSAKLALSDDQLNVLRSKHEQLEQWWAAQFGFGFDCLTQSEARYLERSSDADTIRNRIAALT